VLTLMMGIQRRDRDILRNPKDHTSGSQSKNWFMAVTYKSQPDSFLDVIWVERGRRVPS
jgi:hypothetical protein